LIAPEAAKPEKDEEAVTVAPFGRFVRLHATHGNALQASSIAFLMGTHRQFPPFVRADDAKALLRG